MQFAILAYAASGAVMHRFSLLTLNSSPHEGPHGWHIASNCAALKQQIKLTEPTSTK